MRSANLEIRVQAGALADAWLYGMRVTWDRRAAAFEAAAPRPGDFTGQATPADLQAAAQRCAAVAQACRAHGGMVEDRAVELVKALDAVGEKLCTAVRSSAREVA